MRKFLLPTVAMLSILSTTRADQHRQAFEDVVGHAHGQEHDHRDHHHHHHHHHAHHDHGHHEHGKEADPMKSNDVLSSLSDHLFAFLPKLVSAVEEAIPWILLGVFVATAMRAVKLPIREHLNWVGGDNLYGKVLTCTKASIIGIFTPLCSCGALPIALGLYEGGAGLPSVVTFLTASQGAGIDSAFITWGLLGKSAALYRLLGAILLAIAAGLATPSIEYGGKKQKTAEKGGKSAKGKAKAVGEKAAELKITETIKKFMAESSSNFVDIIPTIFLGILFTVAFTSYGPSLDDMYSNLDDGEVTARVGDISGAVALLRLQVVSGVVFALLSRTLLLAVALPLQLCEHATVAVASGLIKNGASAGLAFSFLISAPATNLATLTMLLNNSSSSSRSSKSSRRRGRGGGGGGRRAMMNVVSVAAAVVAAALLMSFGIDLFGLNIGLQSTPGPGERHAHGEHDGHCQHHHGEAHGSGSTAADDGTHGHGGLGGPLWDIFVSSNPAIVTALLAIEVVRRWEKARAQSAGKPHSH